MPAALLAIAALATTQTVVVGKWSDGWTKRVAEEAVRLPDRRETRFAVRLTALERRDPLELQDDTAPRDDVTRAGFALEAIGPDGVAKDLEVEVVSRWTLRSRDAGELLRFPWLSLLEADPPERMPLRLGQNQLAVYDLRAPAAPEAVAFRLSIRTVRRTRVALFGRLPRIESRG